MLEKVNRTVEFRGPSRINYFTASFADQQQRARLNERIHEPVVGSDVSVAVAFQVESVEKRNGQLTPPLNHPAEVSGPADVDSRIEGERKCYVPVNERPKCDRMRAADLNQRR